MTEVRHDHELHFDTLIDLGLAQQEAELYLACIRLVPPVLLESVLAETPHLATEITEMLGKLQNRFLLFSASGPFGEEIVEVIDPRIAGRSIATEHIWTVGDSRTGTPDLTERTDDKFVAATRRFEEIFTPLFIRPADDEQTEMVPEDKVSEELAQFIGCAKRAIRGITAFPWAPRVALVWETLKERMAAGCSYKRISDVETFLCFGYNNNQHDVCKVGVNLRVTPLQPISRKFYLVDDDSAFIFWPQEAGVTFGLDATKTRVSPFVDECHRFFSSTWQTSVPAKSILPLLPVVRRKFVDDCYGAASFIGRDIGSGLFDHGAFYQPASHGISQAEAVDTTHVLISAGLVDRSPLGNESFIPALSSSIRRILDGFFVDTGGGST